MKTFLREILITILSVATILFVIQATIQSVVVVGGSMYPTLEGGERLLVSKVVYYLRQPERGDVVVFQSTNHRSSDYIKRIIALPGDTVEIVKGIVYLNGSEVDEPYIKYPASYTVDDQEIPQNSYFVLGDNRDNSNDSHNAWLVPRQNIVGKAWIAIWPPEKWGLIPNFAHASS